MKRNIKKKRTKRLTIRLREDEFSTIKDHSKKYKSMSDYIKTALQAFNSRRRQISDRELIGLLEAISEFNHQILKIGTNINQLAYFANQGKMKGYFDEVIILRLNEAVSLYDECTRKLTAFKNEKQNTIKRLF